MDQPSRTSDPEERLSRDLPELPSTKRPPSPCPARAPGSTDTGEERPPPSCLHLASPLHFVSTHFNGNRQGSAGAGPGAAASSQGRSLSLEALSQEIVSSAISTVVQNTLSAMARLADSPAPQGAEPEDEDATPVETDSVDQPACAAQPVEEEEEAEEEEEFVLLDQSELEQMDEQLGMASEGRERDEATPTDPPSRPIEES